MNYLESAGGVTITRARAVVELATHGLRLDADFISELGDHKSYSARSVLEFLGY